MTCYRPTTLRLASAHCPRAIDFYEQKRPRFHEVFQTGIAAHECLAAVAALAIKLQRQPTVDEAVATCEAVAVELITNGRSFEGEREPPMPAEQAFEGRDLAVKHALEPATTWPVKDCWPERGLAFDAAWRPVEYNDPRRRFRLIFDLLAIIEDEGEDYVGRLALVREYKTAWTTDEGELDTVQTRAQAVGAALVLPDIDGVRREVVNLRTGQIFRDDIWLESGGRDVLAGWRSDLSVCMDALDKMAGKDGRPARPGAGCMSCAWSISCDAAHVFASNEQEMALELARLEGRRAELIKALKVAAGEHQIAVPGGFVGYHKTEESQATASAAMQMWAEWSQNNGDMAGFLAALKPSVGTLKALAKKLHRKDTAEQERCLREWTQVKTGREFGVKAA
jgi:hypothetical protein